MENYEDWKDEYYNKEKVNLKKFFTEKDFQIMTKLGIKVKDKTYTESEFENLYSELLSFYNEENDTSNKKLENFGVKEEEYKDILEKIQTINEEYNF
ncbi:MAG: hypothetical protein IKM97_01705 [Clostridia bacterium]|nr:hypothetical protein [Clostridia bacterium]